MKATHKTVYTMDIKRHNIKTVTLPSFVVFKTPSPKNMTNLFSCSSRNLVQ